MSNIDPFSPDKIALTDAAKELRGPSGKRLHTSTLHRWASRGIRGRILATIKIGGVRYTTRSELIAFLNESSRPTQASPSPNSTELGTSESGLEQRAKSLNV